MQGGYSAPTVLVATAACWYGKDGNLVNEVRAGGVVMRGTTNNAITPKNFICSVDVGITTGIGGQPLPLLQHEISSYIHT